MKKIGKIFLGVFCVLLCFYSNSFAATKKENSEKGRVDKKYEYSVTLKEKFQSEEKMNKNLSKRLYSLLDYII